MTQERMGWAHPSQRLIPHVGGTPPARTDRERGILLYLNLQGTPLPVYGCLGSDGTMWRIPADMQYEDRKANLLKWESEFGQTFPRLTQAEAVDLIGPDANYVYNPWVNTMADMGIETPDGWGRLFPDRTDYTQTKLLQPTPLPASTSEQAAPAPAPAQQSFPFPSSPAPAPVAPAETRMSPTYPADVTFYPTKQSVWDKVKAFFAKLFRR